SFPFARARAPGTKLVCDRSTSSLATAASMTSARRPPPPSPGWRPAIGGTDVVVWMIEVFVISVDVVTGEGVVVAARPMSTRGAVKYPNTWGSTVEPNSTLDAQGSDASRGSVQNSSSSPAPIRDSLRVASGSRRETTYG